MKIRNVNGEVTLSPKEEVKRRAKEQLKELKAKKSTTIKELTERIEAIEKVLGL